MMAFNGRPEWVYDDLVKKHKSLAPVKNVLPLTSFIPVIGANTINAAPGDLVYFNEDGIFRAIAAAFDTCATAALFDVINNVAWLVQIGPMTVVLADDAKPSRGSRLYLSDTIPGVVTDTAPTSAGRYVQQVGIFEGENYGYEIKAADIFLNVAPATVVFRLP